MAIWTSLAGTLARALGNFRHPTRPLLRAIGRVGVRVMTRLGMTVANIKRASADMVIASFAEDYPSDILELVSGEAKEALLGRLDVTKRVPRQLIVEARLKEREPFLVTWKVTKQFFEEEGSVETYVSGWFSDERSPEEWWEEYNRLLSEGPYKIDYSITVHELALVQHRIDIPYQ